MKATKHIPEPVEATVTLEMTEREAKALKILVGGIGTTHMHKIVRENGGLSMTGRLAEKHLGSASPEYDGPLRQSAEAVYNALSVAGVHAS